MILAYNKTRQSEQTFDTMQDFNRAAEIHVLELLKNDYGKVELISEIEVEEIKPDLIIDEIKREDIEPLKATTIDKDKIKDFKVKTFRENIEQFTDETLRIFINFDDRSTIIKEAKKELEKRK